MQFNKACAAIEDPIPNPSHAVRNLYRSKVLAAFEGASPNLEHTIRYDHLSQSALIASDEYPAVIAQLQVLVIVHSGIIC